MLFTTILITLHPQEGGITKTIQFHRTECGVHVLLNVLYGQQVKQRYLERGLYNTDFFEILFFTKGKGRLLVNRGSFDVHDGSVFFMSALQERRWELDGSEEFTVLVFQEEFLHDFFSDKLFTYRLQYFYQYEHPLGMSIDAADFSRLTGVLKEIKDELSVARPDSEHIIRSQLYYLLQTLNRRYADRFGLPLHKADQNHAFQFKRLLETHIRQFQRVGDYAAMLGLSRISLNKAVKAQFNLSSVELLKQRLVVEIQSMLVHAGSNIGTIAFELGFSAPQHLMRFFKTQTGLTPTQYLQRNSDQWPARGI